MGRGGGDDKIGNLKTCEEAVAVTAWVGSTVSWAHFSGDLFWRSFFSFGKLTSNMFLTNCPSFFLFPLAKIPVIQMLNLLDSSSSLKFSLVHCVSLCLFALNPGKFP